MNRPDVKLPQLHLSLFLLMLCLQKWAYEPELLMHQLSTLKSWPNTGVGGNKNIARVNGPIRVTDKK